MKLYDEMTQKNILKPLLPFIEARIIEYTREGKLRIKANVKPDAHWIQVAFAKDRLCAMWHHYYFEPFEIIPRGCRACWKVVYRPRDLRELMVVKDLQADMGLPAKCGLENRPATGHLGGYNAFWYAPLDGGLEGGRKLCKEVNAYLLGKKGISGKAFLKRGCSEMEWKYFPSDNWEAYAPVFDKVEDMLDEAFEVFPPLGGGSNPLQIPHILELWIRYAFEHGDLTYLDFKDKAFMPELTKYNGTIHSVNDFKPARRFTNGTHYTRLKNACEENEDRREHLVLLS